MRRLQRTTPSLADRLELRRRQARCNDAYEAREEWDRYRTSAPARPIVAELSRMAGAVQRCFYCADSRGADIDHYEPIAGNYNAAFRWKNFMLVCTPCNRQKSSRSPFHHGVRSFIDPTRDDPWDHFVYIGVSGLLAPRYGQDGSVDGMGERTLELLSVLNHEAIAEGRQRAARRLAGACRRCLTYGDNPGTRRDLLEAVDDDHYGLTAWFCAREGAQDEPFRSVATQLTGLWQRLCIVA